MDTSTGLIAIIPAIAGSSDTKDKWLRPYCDKPLILHTVHLAKTCAEIVKVLVVTNLPDVAIEMEKDESILVLRANVGGRVRDWVDALEKIEGEEYRLILILNPFFPFRTQENVMECFQRMLIDGLADGIEAVGSLVMWRRESLNALPEARSELRILPYPMEDYALLSLENQENDKAVASLISNPCKHLPNC